MGSAGAAALVWLAWWSRGSISAIFFAAKPGWLALAVFAGLVLTVIQGGVFSVCARRHGASARWLELVLAFVITQPAKYLPGKIWAPVMQRLALDDRAPFAVIALANVELAALTLLQMSALGVACLARRDPALAILAILLGVIGGAALLRTSIFGRLLLRTPRIAAKLGIDHAPGSRVTPFGEAVAWSTGSLVAIFATSWTVLAAIGDVAATEDPFDILGVLFLGFVSGMLAFFVPVGLGVREAATVGIGSMAASATPAALLVAVTVFARGWQLVVDLASAGLGLCWNWAARRR